MESKINFRTQANTATWGAKSGDYTAKVVHNGALDLDGLAARMAMRENIDEALARYRCACVVNAIVRALSEGCSVDLGAFSLSLSVKGTFSCANAAFDPARNSICAVFHPGKRLKTALSGLRPENASTQPKPVIRGVMDAWHKENMAIAMDETVYMSGNNLLPDKGSADEGVWLEDANSGKTVAKARILNATQTTLDCIFDGGEPLEPGTYRICVASRCGRRELRHPAKSSRRVALLPGPAGARAAPHA